jgi:F-type H+-transporting ATPase subunit epsilon
VAQLDVSVVAADRQVWTGAAASLVAATTEGEIGILPGHEPVLAVLRTGVVRIKSVDGEDIRVAVDGGFFSVDQNVVRVLSGAAKLASEIDEASTRAELEQAKTAQDTEREKVLAAHLEALAAPRH